MGDRMVRRLVSIDWTAESEIPGKKGVVERTPFRNLPRPVRAVASGVALAARPLHMIGGRPCLRSVICSLEIMKRKNMDQLHGAPKSLPETDAHAPYCFYVRCRPTTLLSYPLGAYRRETGGQAMVFLSGGAEMRGNGLAFSPDYDSSIAIT